MKIFGIGIFALLAVLAGPARADGGPFGIDHRLNFDDRGIWRRGNQLFLQDATAAVVLGGALWLGNEDPLGHVFWESVDSTVLSVMAAGALKLTFSRSRPTQTDDPNQWFKGRGHNSFPSGEVAEIAGAVTPFVLEYGPRYPAVYALELLPLYDAVARVKVRAHWQSDVLASFALGTGIGWYAHGRETPIAVKLLPHGISVGWSKTF